MEPQEAQEVIRRATDALLSVCDGARSLDAQGFNRYDAQFVRSVGSGQDTPGRMRLFGSILIKYRAQLEQMGFSLELMNEARASIPRQTQQLASASWNEQEGRLYCRTPYNDALIQRFRQIRGRQ